MGLFGVRGYPYGIFDPWAPWDGAWLGWENSSAAAAAAVVAHPLGLTCGKSQNMHFFYDFLPPEGAPQWEPQTC